MRRDSPQARLISRTNSYLGGSAFALIDGYGLSATTFSYVFAANALGLVLAGRITTVLLRRFEPRTILSGALLAHLTAVALLTVATLSTSAGLVVVLPLLWLSLGSLGITFGPITALTMARSGREVGIGSGLLGAAQNSFGALAGLAVGILGGGAPGMAFTMSLCAVLALLLSWLAGQADAHAEQDPSS